MSQDILPDARAKNRKEGKLINGIYWIEIFCVNCGAAGGRVPEENMTFAFYLCNKCHESYGHIAGTYAMPDAEFWKRCEEAQIDKYGKVLTADEIVIELDDDNSVMSKLLKDFQKLLHNR